MSATDIIGASMNLIPELAFQEAIEVGLVKLTQDEFHMEELVRREDALLRGTQDGWADELREVLREMTDPRSPHRVTVGIGYPDDPAQLPYVSILLADGGENTAEAQVGDLEGHSYTLTRTTSANPATVAATGVRESLLVRTEHRGTGVTSQLQVGVWDVSKERAVLLHAAVQWAIFGEKGKLFERGVHDITWRQSGMEVQTDLDPRLTYVPMHTFTISWTYRRSTKRVVPNRITVNTGTFSA